MKTTSTKNWDSDELKDIVRKLYGPEYCQQSNVYIDSFWHKIFAAWMNRDEAIAIMDDLVPQGPTFLDNDYMQALDYHFKSCNDKTQKADLDYKKRHIETHILAYAVSLYSASDVMGQILASSFNVRSSIESNKIYLGSICDALSKNKFGKKVIRKINKLFKLKSFQHLKAFINTEKHVSHINIPYSFLAVIPDTSRSHGMKIEGFVRDEHTYEEKWARDFINVDFIEIFNCYSEIGNEINIELTPRCAFYI